MVMLGKVTAGAGLRERTRALAVHCGGGKKEACTW